jgi:hypothetical protein
VAQSSVGCQKQLAWDMGYILQAVQSGNATATDVNKAA